MNIQVSQFKALFFSACLLAAISNAALAQTGSRAGRADELRQTLSSKPQPPAQPEARTDNGFTLEDGTVVKLKLTRDLLSSEVEDEDTIDFEVIEDVMVDSVVVIPRGAKAEGAAIDAQSARRMGRTGRVGVRLDGVFLANGERIPLRAVSVQPNGNRAEKVISDTAVAAMVFFPAAPLILLKKGKEITIPKGTLATSFVDGDRQLDREAFVRANERRP